MVDYRTWFFRGLRLAVIVALLAAGWKAWSDFERFQTAITNEIHTENTYRCGAGLDEALLATRKNEFGNINLKGLCEDRDFWVSPAELDAVRRGAMDFSTGWEPIYPTAVAVAGLLGAIVTVLLVVVALAAIRAATWIWGK